LIGAGAVIVIGVVIYNGLQATRASAFAAHECRP